MKLATLVLLFAAAGLGPLASTSCSVDRRSSALACTTDDDCHDGRDCDRGYCVEHSSGTDNTGCPNICASCPSAFSCQIECSADHPCGDLDCPIGYSCEIKCNGNKACGVITCDAGLGCEITCNNGGSCGDINCAAACKCDVHCNGSGACGDMTCPARTSSCTHDQMAGAPCDSSVDPLCNLCPGG